MNDKEKWLNEAIDYIDSLSSEGFEEFLLGCIPCYSIDINYAEIKIGKTTELHDAANMDCYYSDSISLAA